ncbi:MAG: lamin tail domain-containing protein [Phycisphaerales bacterium]
MLRSSAVLAAALLPAIALAGSDAPVAITQIYGGGGLTNAVFTNDYVELFNRSQTAQNIGGWTLQFAASTGSIWTATTIPADTILQPGQYYLIQQAGGAQGSPLPAADLVGTINMGTSNGKVALVRTGTLLSGTCPIPNTDVVDLVGYGASNCAEGLTAGALSSLTSVVRIDSCVDTDANRADFTVITPNPRTSANTDPVCPPPPPPDCPAEFNMDGALNADDLGDFINCYFGETGSPGSCPQADFNNDTNIDADDLGDYINAYFAGCD